MNEKRKKRGEKRRDSDGDDKEDEEDEERERARRPKRRISPPKQHPPGGHRYRVLQKDDRFRRHELL